MTATAGGPDTTQSDIGEQLFGRFDDTGAVQIAPGLLDVLRGAGFKVGARDRVHVAALAGELATRLPHIRELRDLRAHLAPLLARSPAERAEFFRIFDTFAPLPPAPPVDTPDAPRRRGRMRRWLGSLSWRRLALGAFALLLIAVVALLWRLDTGTPQRPAQDGKAEKAAAAAPPATLPAPGGNDGLNTLPAAAGSAQDYVARIVDAARNFDGAPSLDELSQHLALHSPIHWSAAAYAQRLQELTGLPRYLPLRLTGASKGGVVDSVGLALLRIETPGTAATLKDFEAAATRQTELQNRVWLDGNFAAVSLSDRIDANTVAGLNTLMSALNDAEAHRANNTRRPMQKDVRELIDWAAQLPVERDAALAYVRSKFPGAYNDDTIERALATVEYPAARRNFPGAPWAEARRASDAEHAPAWTPWAALLTPLLATLAWLFNGLFLRRAYLRRRTPLFPPLHMDLIAEAAAHLESAAALFQRIGNRLQRRIATASDRPDIAATVRATIAQGGAFIVPRFATVRAAPEYLVLIEKRGEGDQNHAYLRSLVLKLKDLVALDIYSYQSEPSLLEPEGGGRAVPIERLAAAYPNHRLLVLGSGAGFLDPTHRKPLAGAAMLMHWPRRALLTPVPLAEWAREEFLLAHELALPIGRATPEGLMALAELLRLEGIEDDELLDPSGDGLAQPLPDVLRLRPQRYLYNEPPADHGVPQIVQDLRNYLTQAGFEWLCALAVYPAVQWDLTIYLGVMLPATAGGIAARAPLYTEDQLAALTQLPWLREGRMPDWLRRPLIAAMSDARAREVRQVLQALIKAARSTGDDVRDEAIRIRIGREPARDAGEPTALYDDEVLLDFMARGAIEDFEFPNRDLLARFLPDTWLRRFGWPELAAGFVALVYAAAAFVVVPKPWQGALVTGAWMPLAALGLAALGVWLYANGSAAYVRARRATIWLAPYGLAVTVAAALYLTLGVMVAFGATWSKFAGLPQPISDQIVTRTLPLVLFAAALLFPLPAARTLSGRAGIAVPTSRGVARRILMACVRIAIFDAAVIGAVIIEEEFSSRGLYLTIFFGAASLCGLLAFALGFVATRFMPEKLPPSRGRLFAALGRGAIAVFALLALVPIAPAILLDTYLDGSHATITPASMAITDAALIAATPDGRYIATGGADGIVHVFSVSPTLVELTAPPLGRSLQVGRGRIVALAIAPLPGLGLRVAVAVAGGNVLFYALNGGKAVRADTQLSSTGSPPLIALGPNGDWAVAVENATGTAQIVTAGGTATLPSVGPVTALANAGRGRYVYGALDGSIGLSAPSGAGIALRPGPMIRMPQSTPTLSFASSIAGEENFPTAEFAPDGTQVLTTAADDTARIWDPHNGDLLQTLTGHRGKVWSAHYAPDGLHVVTASDDKTARIWNKANGTFTVLAGHTKAVYDAVYSRDGTRIVTASDDNTARIWDAATGKPLLVLAGHTSAVDGAAFSPDGARVVTASDDGSARVWDAKTGHQLLSLPAAKTKSLSADYAPDGSRIVTASVDGQVRLWDAKTGKLLLELAGHGEAVYSARYSADGGRIVTASDGAARIWDANTGQLLRTLSAPDLDLLDASFSPDGARVVTASTVDYIWSITTHGQTPIHSLQVDAARGTLTAVDTSGAVIAGKFAGGAITRLDFTGTDDRLALGPAILPAAMKASGSVSFIWPVAGPVISDFGTALNDGRNDGINIAVPYGMPIHAAAAGQVSYAGNELRGYGNLILIKHVDSYTTAYAHADRIVVNRGDRVIQGQVIGYAGQTGDVASPQLHFEIRKGVAPVNPRAFLGTMATPPP